MHYITKEIYLSQEKYINDALKKFNMLECKRVSTPLQFGIHLSKITHPTTNEKKKNAIKSLMYLITCIKLDLAFVVQVGHLA
jgi:hypothetical protein